MQAEPTLQTAYDKNSQVILGKGIRLFKLKSFGEQTRPCGSKSENIRVLLH